ncbi:MAG: glycoside hydrolase family 127 protein [Candidatus Lokiarchaeota archaeon]|nr:glycoside hydrolase family 127 protein [Candidatus Lokiarchaeota archaeon]
MDIPDYPLKQFPFYSIKLVDKFWKNRLEANSSITIPHVLKRCEKSKRIANFEIAGGLTTEKRKSKLPFDDSDVFKILEGVAYTLKLTPNDELENYANEIINKIAAAQEDDGYLYTHRTINPENPPIMSGKKRWEILTLFSHELYNLGHLYEAAVAYFEATGKETLLNVAIKNAELVLKIFGYGKNESPPGHQEIEIGLLRMFNLTKEERYLNLAKFFLDIRGQKDRKGYDDYVLQYTEASPMMGSDRFGYNQTHEPVTEQKEAVGHAVRAIYMYCAMADIAAYFKDKKYLVALDLLWNDVVQHKISITGGIGASANGEAFDKAYILPNYYEKFNEVGVYNETCASIANIFWNFRMHLIHGTSKYIDILERTLYNGLLSGISLEGDKFFYPNPLASEGDIFRRKWFDIACCPSNIVRFIPQIQSYIYSLKDSTININLFIGSIAKIDLKGSIIELHQKTNYPWEGLVEIDVNPSKSMVFSIALRIPGWARNNPVPSDLYSYLNKNEENIRLEVNNKSIDLVFSEGYCIINQTWKRGDRILIEFPMPVRRVLAHEKVKDCNGMVALERGPIVYCIESIDNDNVEKLKLNDNTHLDYKFQEDLLHGIVTITGSIQNIEKNAEQDFLAIPYYSWAHRGRSEMIVWMDH